MPHLRRDLRLLGEGVGRAQIEFAERSIDSVSAGSGEWAQAVGGGAGS